MGTSYKDENDVNQEALIDATTDGVLTVTHPHHEKHQGSDFFVIYSIASLGALTTPNDTMTLTFTTPNTAKWAHFTFRANGTGGWRVRLIEGSTGGGATPTGSLTIMNSQRNSSAVSTFKDVAGTPVVNKVSYDATLLTGGITIWDEYLSGSAGPLTGGEVAGHEEEIILKANTTYQLSMFGTDTDPGVLRMSWYEHTNK